MNCTYHPLNQISSICVAPHKCRRKLCEKCEFVGRVDFHKTIVIDKFRELLFKKLHEYDQTAELTKQKMNLKSLLCQTESVLKEIWGQLQESITQIYDIIEMQNKLYLNPINENTHLAELSETEINRLVQIFEGKPLNDWNELKNSYLMKLEKVKDWWVSEIKAFNEKLKKEMKSILQGPQLEKQKDLVYVWQEDLYQILLSVKEIDEQIFCMLIDTFKREKITDCLEFLPNYCKKANLEQQNIKFITNVIKNIQELDFNKQSYSTEKYIYIRKDLINKISKQEKILHFLQFLVHLTAIDNQFIQCGSNSLHLLVEMKVDLREQCFENIKIKDTQLIGANFVRCNFNGSQFNNVDISGMSLNGAQLFNCKWNNLKIQELNKLDGNTNFVYSVCFSPDDTTLATGSKDRFIRLWDVKTGQQKAQLDGHTHYVNSVSFSPNGTTLASGSDDKSIRLWDVKTGQQKAKLDGHSYGVTTVCFSPDGILLASGSVDNSIRLWDVKKEKQKARLDAHTNYVYSVCFSPDGATLASSSYDNSICLWDVKTGQQKAKLEANTSSVNSVCFSPDGFTLASGSDDKSIRLWDVKTGQQKAKLDGHSYGVTTVCFSPDGTLLASSSYDNSICLWDVKTGQQKTRLDAHSSSVNQVCFSPDGTTLASGSCDSSIRLWDVNRGHRDDVRSVCFSPDGTTLASSIQGKSIHLWDFKTGKLIEPSEKSYKGIIEQFKKPVQNHQFSQVIPTLLIAQCLHFEAYSALIFQGEFINDLGQDLRQLFKERGGLFLESPIQQQIKQN